MANPTKAVVASKSAMASYLGTRPINSSVFLDDVLIQRGDSTSLEYFTQPGGSISLLRPIKPIN